MKLRPIEPEDLELLYTIENDPEIWDTTTSEPPFSRYALKQYVAASSSAYACGELRLIIEIADAKKQKQAIGLVELINFSPLAARAEVGIALLKDYRNKGYGQRALALLEAFAISRLRMHLLYARASVNNEASQQLFRKSGYEVIAELPDWVFESGSYQPATLFLKILQKKSVENWQLK